MKPYSGANELAVNRLIRFQKNADQMIANSVPWQQFQAYKKIY